VLLESESFVKKANGGSYAFVYKDELHPPLVFRNQDAELGELIKVVVNYSFPKIKLNYYCYDKNRFKK